MILHVDVANVTGALRLYESVGMRPVLEIDAWAKGEPRDCGRRHTGLTARLVRGSPQLLQASLGEQQQRPASRGAPLPAYVGHDNRLTIGSRERVATATMAAEQQWQADHDRADQQPRHRRGSGPGSRAPCASVVPTSQR